MSSASPADNESVNKTEKKRSANHDLTSEFQEWAWLGGVAYTIYLLVRVAYKFRMGAIEEFGPIIHEFDPYFNYRATEYLYEHGWKAFTQWFDYMSWYPLGRPVGTTIFPGMQVTSVFIKNHILPDWSLNDICCYVPAWFGAIASFFTGMIAYECSTPANTHSNFVQFVMDILDGKISEYQPTRKRVAGLLWSPAAECGLFAMAMMAVVPAHLMRSIGGGYDNEAVAMSAMVMTFYFWVRALRADDRHSHWYGIVAGLAYFYMVAAWGGYIFVLNMVGFHAAVLVLLGRFRRKVWAAYSLFYIVGTALAVQVPVVGWVPLKSLEQLGPCAVFLGYQVLYVTEEIRQRKKMTRTQAWKLRFRVVGGLVALTIVGIYLLAPKGYFGPISARVRGLFVKHTKTGNPLVDSVAEHQAASPKAYFQYLHHVCTLAPIGFLVVWFQLSDASSFLICWGLAAYFFSHKMVRLLLLTGPIGSVLGGILVGRIFVWGTHVWWNPEPAEEPGPVVLEDVPKPSGRRRNRASGSQVTGKKGSTPVRSQRVASPSSFDELEAMYESFQRSMKTKEGLYAKRTLAVLALIVFYLLGSTFVKYSWSMSRHLSNPTVVSKARTRDGRVIVLDDYREAYFWLRDNTPEDARIMAWWDYGYQIAGIANRTTIADGNTWNHEHIALLGKALTTDLDEGYEISRHWADYVLIWGGGGGDDLAKSPHLARIATSVYRDHCPDDPTCRGFGFIDRAGTPSPMMRRSLLYNLHSSGFKDGVEAPADKFVEVYRSKYGKVRIWKILGVSEESKAWVADPANRRCDVPGSWFCPGQYPPGLNKVLASKKDFRQLGDFNFKSADGMDENDEYTKQYFANLNDPETARRRALEREREMEKQKTSGSDAPPSTATSKAPKLDPAQWKEQAQILYHSLQDSEQSTLFWEYIHSGQVSQIKEWLALEPWWAYVRSADGRGPMWWAYEEHAGEVVQMLKELGVPTTDRDLSGHTPQDLSRGIEF